MSERSTFVRRIPGYFVAELTVRSVVFVLAGAALGTGIAVFCELFGLPVYLDATGAVAVAFLAGPWSALLAGFLTNAILGSVFNPTFFTYAPVNMVVGLIAGYLFLGGWTKSYSRLAAVGLVLSVVAVVASVAITLLSYGGLTGIRGTAVVDVYLVTGSDTFVLAGGDVLASVAGSSFIVETADKVLTVVLAYVIAKDIPTRYRPDIGKRVLPHTDSFLGSDDVGVSGMR